MELWGKFLNLQADIRKINHAVALLVWDQQTYMPVGGTEARAESLGYLETLAHTKIVSKEASEILTALEYLSEDPEKGPLYRAAKRDYDHAVKIPTKLVEEMAKTSARAMTAWQEAKAKEDFSLFENYLEKLVDLALQKADALGYSDEPYDALLDSFEPGMTTKDVEVIFTKLKEALVPLVKEIVAKQGEKPAIFAQDYGEKGQWDIGIKALHEMGFDFDCGRQDYSVHPFTISFDPQDVRITTKIDPRSFPGSLFSSMHEGGHALYEQGIPKEWRNLAIGSAASLATHESQSRLWENIVGHSRGYLSHLWPELQKTFPNQLNKVDFNTFYSAINWVEPSLIRVDADEVTYNLHIFLRFEIERELLNGKIKVSQLPEAWNEKVESYLGIKVPSPSLGVLQDIHWSQGSIGYFPTYALGNVMASQFYAKALKEQPSLSDSIAKGELLPLREWLRDKIHSQGASLLPMELVEAVTGESLNVTPYLEYLKNKYLG